MRYTSYIYICIIQYRQLHNNWHLLIVITIFVLFLLRSESYQNSLGWFMTHTDEIIMDFWRFQNFRYGIFLPYVNWGSNNNDNCHFLRMVF